MPRTLAAAPPLNQQEPLAERRARCVTLSAQLLAQIEHAAVTAERLADAVAGAEPVTGGVTLTLRAVRDQLVVQREIVLREQPGLVEGYADALRRAEGQR